MLTLNDGRSELWQWDTGRKLTVDAECSQVHFSNKVFGRSIDVDVVDGLAIIPDILLQTDKDLTAWAFVGTAENGYTKISKTFKVNRRNKPADYVFTPPEQTTLAEIMERLDDLEAIQDPDAIKNAVEDYLEQNPVEVPVESVNGKTGKVNLTATDVGAISQDDLQEATNEALEQAKESGEFDGKDGATFTPSLDDEGNLSWSNDKGLQNPEPKNIRGPQGPEGPAGDVSDDKIAEAVKEYMDSGGNADQSTATANALPVLYLTGDTTGISKEDKVYLSYVWRDSANGKQRSGWCDLKWQGQTSVNFPKKNYKITFYRDPYYENKQKVDLGFGKQSKYTLKGNYQDKTMVRNIIGGRLWGAVVNTRKVYSDVLGDAPNNGTIDGFPFVLYLNDEYVGLYTCNIDKGWMTGLDEDNPLHCLAGQDSQGDGFSSDALGLWVCELPDEWTDDLQTSFQNMLTFVATSTDDEFKASIDSYVDLESAIDYLCFIYLLGGLDSNGKNQMMVTWDGIKWYMSIYDQDSNLGASWTGGLDVATDVAYPDGYQQTSNTLLSRIWALFPEQIVERYNFLRKTVLSLDYITSEIKMFYNAIPQADVIDNSVKWHGSATDGKSQINYHINWITERAVYVDTQINSLLEGYVPCEGITLSASSLTFDSFTEQTLTATVTPADTSDSIVWSSSNESVCTVNSNGVVTPVASGNAVITARCGSHSATCSVSVSMNAIVWSTAAQYRADGDTGYIYDVDVDGENSTYDRFKSNEIRLECGKTYMVTSCSRFNDFVLYDSNHEVIYAEEDTTDYKDYIVNRYFSVPEAYGQECYLVILAGLIGFDASVISISECEDSVWSYDGNPMFCVLPTGEIHTQWTITNVLGLSGSDSYYPSDQSWVTMHKLPVEAGQTVTINTAPCSIIAFYAEDGTLIKASRDVASTVDAHSQIAPDNAAYAFCTVRNYGGVTVDTLVITVE